MKKNLIIASVALLLGTVACKKNETSTPLKNQGSEVNAPVNEVNQKMYDLTDKQTAAVIKSFKNKFSTSINLKSSNNQQPLALDSSIWILEAALNSEFDKPKTTEDIFRDSIKITAVILNNEIGATDFDNAYLNLKNLVAQKTLNNVRVQVIDVTAKIIDNNIEYFLDITLFNSLAAQRIATACDPFTSETASPSKFATVIPSYTNAFLSCGGNPTLDGPSQVELKLNSCSFPACSNGYYYTNVTTASFDGLNNPSYQSSLYYRSIASSGDYCLNTNIVITATQLNQYKSGCNSIASANRPLTPAGLQILNTYDLSLEITSLICCYWPNIAYWKLKVQYGTLNCNNGGGE